MKHLSSEVVLDAVNNSTRLPSIRLKAVLNLFGLTSCLGLMDQMTNGSKAVLVYIDKIKDLDLVTR